MRPEGEVWVRQGRTVEFNRAHQRCIRRLRRILTRKREIQKWNEKYDEWAVRWDELMKQKPYYGNPEFVVMRCRDNAFKVVGEHLG
ncbi:hypothetical protein DUA64_22290 [Salmonella enterica subsp. enterica serovar Abony]|nr:hypothetical protein [Salmonella enterica subsp. enterica serovar Abony]EBY6400965.1 hypothetical protein [Salmonella enterica subsp. enterica serovar Abony]